MMRRLGPWWQRRTIQFRTSVVATAVALIALGVIAHAGGGIVSWLLIDSVDADLKRIAAGTARRVAGGEQPGAVARPEVRVLTPDGRPVDGMPPADLERWQLDEIRFGYGVLDFEAPAGLHRWRGVVTTAPGGRELVVAAEARLVGFADTAGRTGKLLAFASILAAGLVGLATWLVVHRSLRPVERIRVAAAGLPEGERLPVPEAADEIRALAEELNSMLARRDADTERLRRFTGDAAHELRNPVASIRAQAEVAVVHPDPALAQETLQDIARETLRLSYLVESLLALARAERDVEPARPVDLAAAARGIEGVELVVPEGRVLILAAPAEVSTVLGNVIGNAQRYARELIRVSVRIEEPDVGVPAGVRLVVDDDGPGIPPEHRELIFDRFHRVEPDRARSTGGAGLGLALVAEAVRRRGGSVRAGASPEGGARVEVTWPRAPG
ncbi:sensor histidine kinase [Saccharopolyspora griseoalba]|uniref:histidine kinase n=1 Tax=Saccharopolyspora griseoalba TaxID=1431848 RepID=A0ABW2LN34_9PSEU